MKKLAVLTGIAAASMAGCEDALAEACGYLDMIAPYLPPEAVDVLEMICAL
jgi:hypothetical protein